MIYDVSGSMLSVFWERIIIAEIDSQEETRLSSSLGRVYVENGSAEAIFDLARGRNICKDPIIWRDGNNWVFDITELSVWAFPTRGIQLWEGVNA